MKDNKQEVTNIDYKELYEESKFLIEHYKQLVTTQSSEIKNLKNVIEDQKTKILSLQIKNSYKHNEEQMKITGQGLFPQN